MLASTVMWGNSAYDWNTTATSRRSGGRCRPAPAAGAIDVEPTPTIGASDCVEAVISSVTPDHGPPGTDIHVIFDGFPSMRQFTITLGGITIGFTDSTMGEAFDQYRFQDCDQNEHHNQNREYC